MKLGQNLFRKGHSIWGKPIIEYDKRKMDALLAEIGTEADTGEEFAMREKRETAISLETELYLMLHSQP